MIDLKVERLYIDQLYISNSQVPIMLRTQNMFAKINNIRIENVTITGKKNILKSIFRYSS